MRTNPKSPTPPSAAKKAKMPKVRVMYRDHDGEVYGSPAPYCTGYDASLPVSVHPHATAADARRFAAMWNLSDEERVERVARLLCEQAIRSLDSWGTVAVENQVDSGWSEYEAKARAVLALFSAPASRRQRSSHE